MKYTKNICTFFAILSAIILLMTSCIAGPVEENTVVNSVENKQQNLIDSINDFRSEFEDDKEITLLIITLSEKYDLSSINDIEKQKDHIFDLLEKDPDFINLREYFDTKYLDDITNIYNQYFDLLDPVYNDCGLSYEDFGYEVYDTMPLLDSIDIIDSDDISHELPSSVYESCPGFDDSNNIVGNIDYNSMVIIDDEIYDDFDNVQGAEAQWIGFLRNMDGDLYVPGGGWISPDDEDYDFWLAFEDALKNSGLSPSEIQDILSDLSNQDVGSTGFWQWFFNSWIWDLIWAFINPLIAGWIVKTLLRYFLRTVFWTVVDLIVLYLAGPIVVMLYEMVKWLENRPWDP